MVVPVSIISSFSISTLGVGCWVLGVGCWVLGVGCWVLGVGCWVMGLGFGFWVLGLAWGWVLYFGFVFWVWVLGFGFWVLGFGFWVRVTVSPRTLFCEYRLFIRLSFVIHSVFFSTTPTTLLTVILCACVCA